MNYRDFVKQGIPVFSLYPVKGGKCQCTNEKCEAAGKHPRSRNWQYTPLWSDEQLEAMEESGQFATGYGIVVKGLLVIDVDARNGGDVSYFKLAEDFPAIDNCGLVVESGSGAGSQHLYFRMPKDPVALVQKHPDYPGIDFKSSGYVVGPGSKHKSGGQYTITSGSVAEITEAPAELLEALHKPEYHRAYTDGEYVDISDQEIVEMLGAIDPDCSYDVWVKVGMAVHNTTQGSGFDIWDRWSARGTKYPGTKNLENKWHSFGKAANPVTLGTLRHFAELGGWSESVTFVDTTEWSYPEGNPNDLDVSDVDLLRPPGLVGEITAWINSRSRYPRQNLAVAGGLMAVSCAGGMRYIDTLDYVTPNLFLFGVAASATGKEAILGSVTRLLKAAGISGAVHGAFKSDQEIFRNLIRHQAAIYLVDEMGEQLSKLMKAREKSGSAAYLEGIIASLLSLYSKASGFALISGDLKEEIRKSLTNEISHLIDTCGSSPDPMNFPAEAERLKNAQFQLDHIDEGLAYPYLTLFGLTTPERFDMLMNFDMAANGFMGRCLIFRENNDNPRCRDREMVTNDEVPLGIQMALYNLYANGASEVPRRIARIGERVEIATKPNAVEMLDKIRDYFEELAEGHQNTTGLTAIPRRGYEQVAKVSMVLAIPEGLRTIEHVRFAFALVKRDIESKTRLTYSNSTKDKNEALTASIIRITSDPEGVTLGALCNKLRNFQRQSVESTLKMMVTQGRIVEKEGRRNNRYFYVDK